jgi:hypothetical protein
VALQSGQVRLVRSHVETHALWNMWPHAGRTLRRSPPACSYCSMQITHEILSSDAAASEPSWSAEAGGSLMTLSHARKTQSTSACAPAMGRPRWCRR